MSSSSDSAPAARVTVVIPTFNRAEEVQRALRSLAAQTVQDIHVIVVDNSSTDNTEACIHALIPQWQGRLRYIRKAPNGPASARNTGLAASQSPYVLFHDSDIELPPEWVERALARMAADPKMGAVGGYILYAFDEQRVNAYGGDLGRFGLAWDVDEDTPLRPDGQPAQRIWINCSAMLARCDAVRLAGEFDERFFYGYEDSDVGWRLNLTGHTVAVFPELWARHNVDADPGTAHAAIVFHYCKNRLRMILRNAAGWNLVQMLFFYAGYTVLDLILRGPRGAKVRALGWNIHYLGETLALRRAVQRHRQCTDRAVFALGSGRWLPPSPLGGRRRRPVGGESARTTPGAVRPDKADDRV